MNIADKINIICFTEGSLRWFQEIFVRDWIFIDATGFRSLNVPGYKKLLYYALVTRHPFHGYPPLPVAEYITSDHTKDSIYLFLSQIQKNLLSLVNLSSNVKPKLIMTDFSLAIISGVIKEYNRQNLKEYLEKCFQIITDNEEMPSNITVVSVCSAHLLRGIKYFTEKLQWYHRNKALKKIVLKSLGHFVVCSDFSIVKTIVKFVYYVISSKFITDKYMTQLRVLEKAINQYKEGSLDAEYKFTMILQKHQICNSNQMM